MAGRKRLESTSINLNPYQASRPFDTGYEPAFDFAREGRRIAPALGEGEYNRSQRWEAPKEFTFRESEEPRTQFDPITREVQQFKRGAADDDLLFDLLSSGGQAVEDADSWNPVSAGLDTLGNYADKLKERGFSRSMGSIIPAALEEAKAPLAAAKGAGAALAAAKGAGGVGMAAVPLARIRGMATRMGYPNPDMIDAVDQFNRQYPSLDETQVKGLIDLFGNIKQSPAGWSNVRWGMQGSQPRHLLDLAQNATPQNFDKHVDDAAGIIYDITGETPQYRRTPRNITQATREPQIHIGRPSLDDFIGEPYTDLGRFGYGGHSPKRILATADDTRIMHKGSPFWPMHNPGGLARPSDIATIPEHLMLREEAASKFHRKINKRTPEQTAVAEGGLASKMNRENLKNWNRLEHTEIRDAAQDPEVLKQVFDEWLGDTVGLNWDTHGGQYMYDPDTKLFLGVDKGESELAGHVRGRRAAAPEFYPWNLGPGGPFNTLAQQSEPEFHAAVGRMKQIPESEFRSILDPWMTHGGSNMDATDRDSAMRNIMQWINDPSYWQNLYNTTIR